MNDAGVSMFRHRCSKYAACLLAAAIFSVIAAGSVPVCADRLLAWPADEGGKESKIREPLKSHEIRRGGIALSQDILPNPRDARDSRHAATVSKGERVSIRLFDDINYDVDIDSTTHHKNGAVSISGKIRDHRMGTVVTTVGPDSFLMTVHDMNRSRLYRVTGDSRTGVGSVTEIDTGKMPPVIR